MIEQKDVIAFFDERAGEWDAGMVRSDEKIGRILDNAKVTAGSFSPSPRQGNTLSIFPS